MSPEPEPAIDPNFDPRKNGPIHPVLPYGEPWRPPLDERLRYWRQRRRRRRRTLRGLLSGIYSDNPYDEPIEPEPSPSDMFDSMYDAYWDAMDQANSWAQQALQSAYYQQLPQVMNNLAARGIINSSVGGQALAGLGAPYLQGLSSVGSSLANTYLGQIPENINAMTGFLGQQAQAQAMVPQLMLEALSLMPQYNLGTLGTYLGLFDLLGQVFV